MTQREMSNVRARYVFVAVCAAWLVSQDEAAAQRRRSIGDLPADYVVATTEWWGACAERSPPDSLPEAVPLTTDTLDATPVSPRADVSDVWKELVDAGIATLPTSVRRSEIMMDGTSYVVQLRMGQEYRVSRIQEWHTVETPADKAIQRINAILTQRIGWVAGDRKR